MILSRLLTRMFGRITTPDSQPDATPPVETNTQKNQGLGSRAVAVRAARRTRPRRPPTGRKTIVGKRRSALNRLRRGLCPGWVAQALDARGEDPEAFRRLHRDLISWLNPDDVRTRFLVECLAETWWEKRRRIRDWVGAGEPDTREIDARLDDLLGRLVWAQRCRHRQWRYRLRRVFGQGLFAPAQLRLRMESWVPALGGKRPRRLPGPQRPDPFAEFNEIMAGAAEMLTLIHADRRTGVSGGNPESN